MTTANHQETCGVCHQAPCGCKPFEWTKPEWGFVARLLVDGRLGRPEVATLADLAAAIKAMPTEMRLALGNQLIEGLSDAGWDAMAKRLVEAEAELATLRGTGGTVAGIQWQPTPAIETALAAMRTGLRSLAIEAPELVTRDMTVRAEAAVAALVNECQQQYAARGQDIREADQRLAEATAALKTAETEATRYDRTLEQRDAYHDAADELAYAIAGVEIIGEHSSANNPWKRAIEWLESERAQHSRTVYQCERWREETQKTRAQLDAAKAAVGALSLVRQKARELLLLENDQGSWSDGTWELGRQELEYAIKTSEQEGASTVEQALNLYTPKPGECIAPTETDGPATPGSTSSAEVSEGIRTGLGNFDGDEDWSKVECGPFSGPEYSLHCRHAEVSETGPASIDETRARVAEFAAERAKAIPEELGEHTCILTQATSDGSVPPPCKACHAQTSGQLQSPPMDNFQRRNRIDLFTPAEKAIFDAVGVVEAAGAHPHLTKAVCLLQEARAAVADFVDLPKEPQ